MYFLSIFIIILVSLIYIIRQKEIEPFSLGTYSFLKYGEHHKPTDVKAYISVIRHGIRYPTETVHKKLEHHIKTKIDTIHLGKLTPDGYIEMIEYGQHLSEAYPNIFQDNKNYEVFSTTLCRAKQSAQGILYGLEGHRYKKIQYGKDIDQFLKINDFFRKIKHQPEIITCQFSKVLNIPHNKNCYPHQIDTYERRKSDVIYDAAKQNGYLAKKFKDILSKLVEQCRKIENPQGFLFICHDSTLMPLYELLDLLPKKQDYKNEDWVPFGARLELLLNYENELHVYVNGRSIKTYKNSESV